MQFLRNRTLTIFAILFFAIVGFIAGSSTWVNYTLADGTAAFGWLAVSGNDGLAPLMPILIAVIAVAVTLMIAAPIVRVLLGLLVSVLGAWIAFAAFSLFAADRSGVISFGNSALAEASGFTGSEHSTIVTDLSVSGWPLVAGFAGVGIVIFGLVVVVFGRGWKDGGRKYEVKTAKPVKEDSSGDRISDWDSLSDGNDPSDFDDTPGGSTS